MKCPKCGSEVQAEAVYCHVCGARLDDATLATGEPAAETAPGKENFERTVEVPRANARQDVGEIELWQGGFSPKAMIGVWILCGLVTLIALVVSLIFLAAWMVAVPLVLFLWAYHAIRFAVRRLGLNYRLTNQRFFHEKGILSRTTNRIEVIDMDDITFTQGVVDRFFGVGTIKVSSSDVTDPVLVIEGIDDVQRVAGLIDSARRAERLRRGLHIEAV